MWSYDFSSNAEWVVAVLLVAVMVATAFVA
jgi:hypothetical protein